MFASAFIVQVLKSQSIINKDFSFIIQLIVT